LLEEGMTDRTSAAIYEAVGHQDDQRIQSLQHITAADTDAALQGGGLIGDEEGEGGEGWEIAQVLADSESASGGEQGSFADDTALETETPDLSAEHLIQ